MCKGPRGGTVSDNVMTGREEVVQNSLNFRSSAFALLNSNHVRIDREYATQWRSRSIVMYRVTALKKRP